MIHSADAARAAAILINAITDENEDLRRDVREAERAHAEALNAAIEVERRDADRVDGLRVELQKLQMQHSQDVASITALQGRIECDAALVTNLRSDMQCEKDRADMLKTALDDRDRDLEVLQETHTRLSSNLDASRSEVARLTAALESSQFAAKSLEATSKRNLEELERLREHLRDNQPSGNS